VPVNVLTIADDIRILQVLQRVPTALAQDAQQVEAGLLDYQKLVDARLGLKRIFGLTLTLAMLLTLFSALALSFVLSEKLSAPLSALAEATRAIAKGDYSKLNPVKSRDEFGRAHAVLQYDDAPDRRRHRGDGAQPAAARGLEDLSREHPFEPHLRRAHVRRAPLREDHECGRQRHPWRFRRGHSTA
jgi:HAMP domain-containing protein